MTVSNDQLKKLRYGTHYVSADFVADHFDVSSRTIRQECQRGNIPARKVGRQWRIPVSYLTGETDETTDE